MNVLLGCSQVCLVRREAVQVIISRFYTVTRWRRAIDWRCLNWKTYVLFAFLMMLGHVTLKSFVSHRLNDPTLLQLKISSEEKRYSNNFLFKSIKVYLVYNNIFPLEIQKNCCFLLLFRCSLIFSFFIPIYRNRKYLKTLNFTRADSNLGIQCAWSRSAWDSMTLN